MKIFREETFGGVVFDTSTLRFKIVDVLKEEVDKVIPLRIAPPRCDILSAPVRVYFEITRLCNMHCSHCFVSASKNGYYGLETKAILSLINQLYDFRALDIRFTGGEPTERKDWFEILSYAKQLGFSVSLNTNGIYSDVNLMIGLFEKLHLEQITISLDGMQHAHDAIRGRGSFEKTTQNIKALALAGLPLRINTVINRSNVNDIPELIRFASEHVKEINFFYTRAVGRAIAQNDLALSFSEHYKSAIETLALKDHYPYLNIMHFEQSFTERSVFSNVGQDLGLMASFPYGMTTFSIAADGSFWPHGYSPYQWEKLKLGKFPQDSIQNIWYFSNNLDKMRKWFRELMNRCGRCTEYRSRCAGINFEMEIARMVGHVEHNPYCISTEHLPVLDLGK